MLGFLWPKETANGGCPNSRKHDPNDVKNQGECQKKCEAEIRCVGIAYRHRALPTVIAKYGWCDICFDDELRYDDTVYGFYRRPGIWFKFLILYNCNFQSTQVL